MKIVDEGIVFAGCKQTERQSCAFPGICVTNTGRWICSFRAAPSKAATVGQHVLLSWSEDDGHTWSSPSEPFQAPATDDGIPGILRTGYVTTMNDGSLMTVLSWIDYSTPSRPFFNEATEGLLDTRICLASSTDDGQQWSPTRFVSPRPFTVPSPTTGPLVCVEGGNLICQVELNKPYLDTQPWRHQSVLVFSGNGGTSWDEQRIVSDDPQRRVFYWDQRLGHLGSNELLNVFWTFDREHGEYLNMHARRSTDGGRNWSDLWDLGVAGQPAVPVRLDDGNIALVYVDRTTEPCIKVRTSQDGGQTWPAETETTIFRSERRKPRPESQSMQEAWDEMYAFALGLPSTTRLANGDLLVVFYEGPTGDETNIRWARLSSIAG